VRFQLVIMVCHLMDWLIEDEDRSALNVDVTKPGVIGFGKVARDSNIRFSIPFTAVVDQNELDVFPNVGNSLISVKGRSEIYNCRWIIYLSPSLYR
jgi:hypothetical protein